MAERDLVGRRALVCGASAGLGRAVAFALARRGAALVPLARRGDVLDAMAPDLLAAGAVAVDPLVADLSDLDALAVAVDGLDVQILIHNQGGPPAGLLHQEPVEKLLTWFSRHVLSAQVLLHATLPAMKRAGWGRIVTITSTSVREPLPDLGVSNVVRGAMASWVKTLAHELPPGITVNNVLPGLHDTGRLVGLADAIATRDGVTPDDVRRGWLAQVPERRLGDPADFGEVVAFLCSPAGGYVRGAALPVDGGRLRSL